MNFCPESHSEFTHPNPLWKNKSFSIELPFKLNEDINPTKATHPGMSPSDLLLAQRECSQLLAQGLIEPTSSQWACQAFYIEKHSEIVRGKKRLVIDYQPLNMFLQDDKFPLPRRQSMFTFVSPMPISNGQSYPLASKLPHPFFKNPWLSSFSLSCIMD